MTEVAIGKTEVKSVEAVSHTSALEHKMDVGWYLEDRGQEAGPSGSLQQWRLKKIEGV